MSARQHGKEEGEVNEKKAWWLQGMMKREIASIQILIETTKGFCRYFENSSHHDIFKKLTNAECCSYTLLFWLIKEQTNQVQMVLRNHTNSVWKSGSAVSSVVFN
jgi:hypothetical protein